MSVTVRLDLAYDGSGFHGWARQRDPEIRTVQGELEGVLADVLQDEVRLSVAGRTDAGVHARGQVASFHAALRVPPVAMRDAINGALAPEVVCTRAIAAPSGFDARFSASAREYRYRIDLGDVPSPFDSRFVWHRPGDPTLGAMRSAARHLVGEHDFTSFCRHPGAGRSTIRRVDRITVRRTSDRLEIAIRANAFLHQMVRAIVGTLVRIGDGKLEPVDVARLLENRDRRGTGNLAAAHGLTLERVIYGRRNERSS